MMLRDYADRLCLGIMRDDADGLFLGIMLRDYVE
jgi:hypothetical protein